MGIRKSILIISLTISILTICSCKDNTDRGSEESYRTVSYIAGYRDFDFSTIDVSKLTHIIFAFANIIDGEVAFSNEPIDGKVLIKSDIDELLKRNGIEF